MSSLTAKLPYFISISRVLTTFVSQCWRRRRQLSVLIKSPAWAPCCTHTYTPTHTRTPSEHFVTFTPPRCTINMWWQICFDPFRSIVLNVALRRLCPFPSPTSASATTCALAPSPCPPYWCSNSHLIQSKIRMSNFKLWLYLGTLSPVSRNRRIRPDDSDSGDTL